MTIKNKKWTNYIAVYSAALCFIFISSIAPSYYDAARELIKWCEVKNSKDSVQVFDALLKTRSNEISLIKAKINSMLNRDGEVSRVSSYIDDLNDIAKTSGLDLTSIKTRNIEKREKLLVQPLEVELEGNYFQLHSFARRIEEARRTFAVQSIFVRAAENKKAELTIEVNLYVYINL